MAATKTTVTLGGVDLAGNAAITWKLVTGVHPYTAVFQVYHKDWENDLSKRMGQAMDLVVTDSRGVKTTIKDLFILHAAPSDGPRRKAFVVADRRWRWGYQFIARDYNISKRTGDRTAFYSRTPQKIVTVDEYDYRPYSLNDGARWTPKAAIEDVLKLLEPESDSGGGKKKDQFVIESFPIDEGGEFSMQNVSLRDQGDIALSRLMSYVPGAEVYVDVDGIVRVFDGTDLKAAEDFYDQMPPKTWDGEQAQYIDRQAIRPSSVRVYYEREVEMLLEYEDDYGSDTFATSRNRPFIDNVIPTTDPLTTIREYDPETNQTIDVAVPQGTYVTMRQWLAAMEADKPPDSLPWTFQTIAIHWLKGDLEGVLGAKGKDIDEDGNVAMRVQALRQHFRQTFRISRRYVERMRDIKAVRVVLLHPVTGTRAPASVWGQACIVPTEKGKRMAVRKGGSPKAYVNVNYYPNDGVSVFDKPPGPTEVQIIDRDQGIFRLEWLHSPYGTDEAFVPCFMTDRVGNPRSPTRDLSLQDSAIMGPGMRIENGTNGLYLAGNMKYKVLLTIVPAAPNSKKQFHAEEVEAKDIDPLFVNELRIQDGNGPVLEVFVPPGEATARFGLDKAAGADEQAAASVAKLLGLEDDNPTEGGIESSDELLGYVAANRDRELPGHAKSVAAEMLVHYSDALQGNVTGRLPEKLRLVGNIAGVTMSVAPAPSAKTSAMTEFPGRQKPISRLAMMPHVVREVVLGILPTGKQ